MTRANIIIIVLLIVILMFLCLNILRKSLFYILILSNVDSYKIERKNFFRIVFPDSLYLSSCLRSEMYTVVTIGNIYILQHRQINNFLDKKGKGLS